MAVNNWAKVYFHDSFAGILEEEPGGRTCFTYDESYLQNFSEPISYCLPLSKTKHVCENALHPFFDNLVAEGSLANIQAKALNTNPQNRFKLLMAFGHDLIGAVRIVDPDPNYLITIDNKDYLKQASIQSRASISGVQPKLVVRKKGKRFFPTEQGEISTHIAKLPGQYPKLIENEYLCTLAAKELLKSDQVVDLEIAEVEGIGKALIVKRFDRDDQEETCKIHFEEFSQLLNFKAIDKYDASYTDLANFMNSNCSKIELEKLFRRILACILLGNTDAHLKNFAMFHRLNTLELTPIYDMVFVAYYDDLSTSLALGLNKDLDLDLGDIKAKHLRILCEDFELKLEVLDQIFKDFESRLDKVLELVESQPEIDSSLRKAFKEQIKKRWNGTFKNLGKVS